MRRGLRLFGAFFLLIANTAVNADEPAAGEKPPGFRGREVVLDIDARVIEQNQVVIWNETHQRITMSGSPVGIKLVGANIVVVVQFTPYLRRDGQSILVAQGQIWMEIPDQGVRYQTSMQTIPIDFDEPIYFFPLGPSKEADKARIEIMLTMRDYKDVPQAETPGVTAQGGH
ncbi:hypothetical protein AGMMS50293_10760 [Spirochaetia bacterium]|nr:hypothetical protein AGMMS50293_10760 [Spirochaetia bacterium]